MCEATPGSNPTDQTVLVPSLQTQNLFDSKTRPRAVLPVPTDLRAKGKLRKTVVDDIFVSTPVALVRTNRLQTGFEFRKEESRYVPWEPARHIGEESQGGSPRIDPGNCHHWFHFCRTWW